MTLLPPDMHPIVIIGSGHNGLAAAFYLAKAGLKPIVLERTGAVGGGAVTGDLHEGFRCPTLSHEASIRADIARDMNLDAHGLQFLPSTVRAFAGGEDGRGLVLYEDVHRSAEAIRAFSSRDAERYVGFRSATERASVVLASLLDEIAPAIGRPNAADLWRLLKSARRFRALGRADAFRLLRWVSMSVADMMDEWFETDVLKATLAGPSVSGGMLGPRSAGSALVLLVREARDVLNGPVRSIRGGAGALTAAMASAARAAGADIRICNPVEHIVVSKRRVTGVVVAGTEIPAAAVVSSVDPKTTFSTLVASTDLPSDFLAKIRNYRAKGTLAKVNLALSTLPSFTSAHEKHVLTGRIHIGPHLDDLERAFDAAKYGQLSDVPWLEVRIPSLLDPTLAPPGAHVLSLYAHYAPYHLQGTSWDSERDTLLVRVLDTLDLHAPRISESIVAAQVITPLDLERTYGYAGGHIFHGELALDQLLAMRPVLGYARYESPIDRLFLCGAGTPPGGFMGGASGKGAAGAVARRLKTSAAQGGAAL